LLFFINDFYFLEFFFEEFFLGGASPGSAGCFKKPTQIPNAGHPICVNLRRVNICVDLRRVALIHIESSPANFDGNFTIS
jgi:hypothetical protein